MNTLVLFLTYNCNLNCSYCYQIHAPTTMTLSAAQKSVDLLLISSSDSVHVDLYCGEPFLCFDMMRDIINYAVNYARRLQKKISFRTTTSDNFKRLSLGNISKPLNVSEIRKRAHKKQFLFPQSQDEFRTDSKKCVDCDFVLMCDVCCNVSIYLT